MFFCPFCGTLLLLTPTAEGNQLRCSTCVYAVPIDERCCTSRSTAATHAGGPPILTITHPFLKDNRAFAEDTSEGEAAGARKGVAQSGSSSTPGGAEGDDDSALEANAGAEGGQVITVPCQNEQAGCDSRKAFYIQVQMRSADEPPSTFFRCVKCGFQWRQD